MMLSILTDSAIRSLLLGLAVWALLKLARLCDTRTETAIWTAVLIAAWSMPLLSRFSPSLVLIIPHLPAAPPESVTALSALASGQGSPQHAGLSWQTYLLAAYAVGLFVCLTRIAVGLLLTVRLYRRAVPVDSDWAEGRNIRASGDLKSPVSLANTIVLPDDYGLWSQPKRDAVLAHEEAHIARADFFVQLAARFHCAVFWFSPFAWWLQSKLAIIAENASDEAAILRLDDRAAYAEILIEVSRCAQKTPLIVGMANGPFIQQRVDHILSDTPSQNLSLPLRVVAVTVLAALAFAVAGAKALVSPAATAAVSQAASAASQTAVGAPVVKPALQASSRKHAASSTPTAAAGPARPRKAVTSEINHGDVTYNPRALLDPLYAPKPSYGTAPVADVTVTYGSVRRK